MVIVMQHGASAKQISAIVARVEALGYRAHLVQGEERTIIGVIGDDRPIDRANFETLDGVDKTIPILKPFKLASRDMHPQDTLVSLDGVKIGGPQIVIMAGPCSVETREQIIETAIAVKEAGAHALRGGAFKPRSSPYSFQGLGEEGLELLAEARHITGLPIVTEVMSPDQIPLVTRYADMLQIGARNMQNYSLLQAVGKAHHPVLLKRGMMSTIEELLMSAEYLLANGNSRVVLCERGIRTFEKYTRNTTDINAVPVIKQLSHLPVVIDPSHGTGKWEYVAAVARAGVAAGADGLIVEVHPHPEDAWSDGAQSLKPEKFAQLVTDVKKIAEAVGRC
ncbi:MAG: 3-deoxy-7-phosphoheptulonate synthase [Chloroflexi bacterium]|jgi:3-deoxy-7-phosphoheptulonate synthase|nr:3-deoxy-7-phosphoheptulonate synthase [Chloroflexota bacterium]